MSLQHRDPLSTRNLRSPMLDQFMGSTILRGELVGVANEIMRRHLAKLPSDTGNLRSTARVTARRSTTDRDRRWEAEYSIGGPRADYIRPLEEEHHYLADVLREMGYGAGGDRVQGPTGRLPTRVSRPQRRSTSSFSSDDEQRRYIAEQQQRFAEERGPTADDIETRADREALEEAQRIAAGLESRRVGSQAAKSDYEWLYKVDRVFGDDERYRSIARTAMEAHEAARAARGLEPNPLRAVDDDSGRMRASTVRTSDTQALLDQADALNRPGRRIGSRLRDSDYRALRSATEALGDQPGVTEARSQAQWAMQMYRQLREARGLPGEPD